MPPLLKLDDDDDDDDWRDETCCLSFLYRAAGHNDMVVWVCGEELAGWEANAVVAAGDEDGGFGGRYAGAFPFSA